MSRPTKPIDLDHLEKLAILHCTDEEIASFFGITVRTSGRRKQNPVFAAILENGRNKAKALLRRFQFEKAQQGNVTMLIWLGKQVPPPISSNPLWGLKYLARQTAKATAS